MVNLIAVMTLLYTSLFARKAAATSEKKHQTHTTKTNKQKKKLRSNRAG